MKKAKTLAELANVDLGNHQDDAQSVRTYLLNEEPIYNKFMWYVHKICKDAEKNPSEKAIIDNIYYWQTNVYKLVCECVRDWAKLTKGERYKVARMELALEVIDALDFEHIKIQK